MSQNEACWALAVTARNIAARYAFRGALPRPANDQHGWPKGAA